MAIHQRPLGNKTSAHHITNVESGHDPRIVFFKFGRMDRFGVLVLGFGAGYADTNGITVFLNKLLVVTPVNTTSRNLNLIE